mgnify:CR=1 FL=1
MKDVIIFAGSALGSVLAIARNIKEEFNTNCYVVCLNSKYTSAFSVSKFVTESTNIIGITDDDLFENYKIWVAQKDFKAKPIVFFTTDISCLFADKYREWFENHFLLTIPSSQILKTYNFKGVAENNAKENGLIIPQTKLINTVEDTILVTSTFRFPVIIKPTSSKTKQSLGFKVKIIQKPQKFEDIAKQLIAEDKEFLCQEYVPGNDKKVHYYIFYRDKHGMIWETMGIKTLQCPPNGGIMAKGISMYNDKIEQMSRKFLDNINYTGIGGIEYKEYNGQYYFIEMSTRPEGFYLVSEKAEVPISTIVYKMLSGFPVDYKCQQKDGIKYIDLLSTLIARKISKKYFRLIIDYFDAVFNPKTCINAFKLNDVMPFIKYLKLLFK